MSKLQYRDIGINIVQIAIKVAVILLLIVLFYLGFTKAYHLGNEVFTDNAIAETGDGISDDITIVKGQSALSVGKRLEEKGIITDAYAFWIQTKLYEVNITPGTYTVSSEMSSKDIAKMMDGEQSD